VIGTTINGHQYYCLALGLTVECRAHKGERKVSGGTVGYSIPPGYLDSLPMFTFVVIVLVLSLWATAIAV